ncbi:methyltransferase family protein [Bordetella tumulicola]|uniref:methyltransferase family protein n=1 Tax=Bordetella tumulicola TaxID=1649133 RepID=UPI0039F0C83F
MKSLEMLIYPPFVMLGAGALMRLLAALFPTLTVAAISNSTVAIIIGLIGLAAGAAGAIALSRARTTADPKNPGGASALVAAGVYQYTRNPMYLGGLIVLIGWAVYLANISSLLGIAAFIVYMNRYQIEPEERFLKQNFGADYEAYCAKVRRWI